MSSRVARMGDMHDHGGQIISASSDVFANAIPVARVGDEIVCPQHGRETIISGNSTVLVNGRAIATVGSRCSCGAVIISGSFDVLVGG